MTTDNHAADDEAPIALRKPRHLFVVNAGLRMFEFEIEADDFEVTAEGVHFVANQGLESEHVRQFVSHPCIVRTDDEGTAAAARVQS